MSDPATFTPLFDCVTRELGVISAAVLGRMWRYAQMPGGICRASFQTIADDLRLGRRTVIEHVDQLKAAGYLVDVTPARNRAIHSYQIVLPSSAPDALDADQSSAGNALDEKPSSAPNALASAPNALDAAPSSAPDAHKDTSTKRHSKRQEEIAPELREDQVIFAALQRACNMLRITDSFRGWANQTTAWLREKGYSAADVDQFAAWWTSDPWKAQHTPMSFDKFDQRFGAWVNSGKPERIKDTNGGGNHAGHERRTSELSDSERQAAADQLAGALAASQRKLARRARDRPGEA